MQTTTDNLFDIVPCGIVVFSNEGLIRKINCSLLNELGFNVEELEGKNIESILSLSSRIFYQTHLFPLLKLHKRVEEIFLILLTKAKEPVPVLLNAIEAHDDGRVSNICTCITVNERKKYEDEILQAKRTAEDALNRNDQLLQTKQELETNVEELDRQLTELKNRNNELLQLNELIAHDLQEPVRKISLFSDLIITEKAYSEKTPVYLHNIEKGANRIRRLLLSLQEYVAVTSSPVVKESVDLKKLLAEQLQQVAQRYPGVQYHLNENDLPVVHGDRKQLAILFNELLDNSFKFRSVERNLMITISSSLVQENAFLSIGDKYRYVDFVKIDIADNGVGFDSRYSQHIFKILKKLELDSVGLGFGLAISKRIVENHRGYISATATKGKGATFTVALPIE